MKRKLELTLKEIILAVALAVMGFLFSTREFILFLNVLTPLENLLVYYIILYGCMFLLSYAGLIIYKFRIDNPIKVFGLLMITFAFFIVVDWESCYMNMVSYGNCNNVSNVYFGSEDGATWDFWYNIVGIKDMETSRILTYVITPFILAIIGCFLVTGVDIH